MVLMVLMNNLLFQCVGDVVKPLFLENIIPWPTSGPFRDIYVFFHYQVGSLVDYRAYKPYTLAGPTALRLVLDP